MLNFAHVKKILILDFSRIGDTLMHDPALRAIKLKFPHAQIDALTDKPNFDLLAYHPAIHHATVFPRKVRSFKTLLVYVQTLLKIRRQKYDLLVNFYMGRATPLIARSSGIPLRLVFGRCAKLRKSHNLIAKSPSSYSNWIVETNEIVRPLGIDPDQIWPQVQFTVSAENKEWARLTVPIQPETRYAAFQLATSAAIKCWPPAEYAELAEKLYREHGLVPVLISSPDQLDCLDTFCKMYPRDLPYIRLPVIPLAKLAGVLDWMTILISGDTGVMHLGFGVGLPTVCIYTHERPEYTTSATTNKMVVFREDETKPKYPSGQLHGTSALSVTEVYDATQALLHIISG